MLQASQWPCVIIGLGMGMGMGAFNVALLAVTPGTEKGISMGIMSTFRGMGGMIAPVIGGYFLNEALDKNVTFGQAFTNLYLVAAVGTVISVGLILYFIFRSRKVIKTVQIPVPQV